MKTLSISPIRVTLAAVSLASMALLAGTEQVTAGKRIAATGGGTYKAVSHCPRSSR